MKTEFIGKNGLGIPKIVFDGRNYCESPFVGGSGYILNVSAHNNKMEIRAEGSLAMFICALAIDPDLGPTVGFSIYCYLQRAGQFQPKHPDFFASQLFEAGIHYWQNRNRINVAAISAQWFSYPFGNRDMSSNYQMYIRALDKCGALKEPNTRQKLQAAAQTWTGMQARKMGFTPISVESQIVPLSGNSRKGVRERIGVLFQKI